jgi:hypothetical protein
MAQPRTERNSSPRARRERDERSISREGFQRAANRAVPEREDQADSGPDRDHRITRQSRKRSG